MKHKGLGVVYTPDDLVRFMVGLIGDPKPNSVVLEPGCGENAPFLKEFISRFGNSHDIVGIDVRDCKPDLNIQFVNDDFILWDSETKFDIILGNPPYGIIGSPSHYAVPVLSENKKAYKRRLTTWFGKYNIYAAFIERAIQLLNDDGILVFVVPASWLVLDDFKLLRRYLSENGSVEIYYVGSVFSGVNVKAVVFKFVRSSSGMKLFDVSDGVWRDSEVFDLTNREVVWDPFWVGDMVRFMTPEWEMFELSGVPLSCLFDIRFAAQSTEYKELQKDGVVTKLKPNPTNGIEMRPVLTGRNLSKGHIDYSTCYSGLWVHPDDVGSIRDFYTVPHLVVGHTKGTQLICAVDKGGYAWREEFHLVPNKNFKERGLDLYQVCDYLNSDKIQNYLMSVYRGIVPHLTKSMLERVPVRLDKPDNDRVL